MKEKVVKILINIIIIFIPLFWINLIGELFWVSYFMLLSNEWFKVHIFNILMWLLGVLCINSEVFLSKISKKIIYLLIWLWLISAFWSLSISNSLFPILTEKSHNLIFFSNLILFWLIVKNTFTREDYIKSKKIILSVITTIWFIGIFREIFLRWDEFRLIWTFEHHNFIAPVFIIWIILSLENLFKSRLNTLFLGLNLVFLILTKWFLAITLWIIYISYKLLSKKLFILSLVWYCGALSSIIYFNIDKFNSLISRFFIWKNSIILQFSEIKTVLFWVGFENLYDHLHKIKLPELYIYENFWYVADRTHNFFLDILVFSWILSFILFIIWFFFIAKKASKEWKIILLTITTFLFFNFPTLVLFLYLIILINEKIHVRNNIKLKVRLLHLIAIIGLILSSLSLISSYKIKEWDLKWASKFYALNPEISYKLGEESNLEWKTVKYFAYKIAKSDNKYSECEKLVNTYNISEIYVYCWDILYENWFTKKAKEYYKKWLSLLPNLDEYNLNEKIKKSAEHRLNSERYWLKKVKKRIED